MFSGCRFWSTGITTPVGGEGQVEVGHIRNYFTNCYFDGVRVSILDTKYEAYFTACTWNEAQDAEAIYVDTTATGETVAGLNVVNCNFDSDYASPITFNGTGTYADDIDKKINWSANVDELGASAWYGAKFGAGNQITGGVIGIADGVTAPSTVTGVAQLYVDTADGDLKVKFGDGTVKGYVDNSSGIKFAQYSITSGNTSAPQTIPITEEIDPDNIGTVSGGEVTLGAGTYQITHYGEYDEDDNDDFDYFRVHTRHNGSRKATFTINETDDVTISNGYLSRTATFLVTSASSQTVDIEAEQLSGATLAYRNVRLSILKLA
jgi:hypothetical protein